MGERGAGAAFGRIRIRIRRICARHRGKKV
jgi:hypothetical protein